MKLWLLGATEKGVDELTYDCANGFVVRAMSAPAARKFASQSASDEGAGFWLDPVRSECSELKPDGDEGVVLQDFHAG